jgi:hypothetical protein
MSNTTTTPINPQAYGIHTSSAAAYLRTAYGEPGAIAFYNGTGWVARPMRDFRPNHPGPHGHWVTPCTEVTADTPEAAFATLGFPLTWTSTAPRRCRR